MNMARILGTGRIDGGSLRVQAAVMPYYRLAVADGVLREMGGQVFTRQSLVRSLFADVHGQQFDSMLEEIASDS